MGRKMAKKGALARHMRGFSPLCSSIKLFHAPSSTPYICSGCPGCTWQEHIGHIRGINLCSSDRVIGHRKLHICPVLILIEARFGDSCPELTQIGKIHCKNQHPKCGAHVVAKCTSLEQVRAWIGQAGLVIEEEGTGNGYEHFMVRKR